MNEKLLKGIKFSELQKLTETKELLTYPKLCEKIGITKFPSNSTKRVKQLTELGMVCEYEKKNHFLRNYYIMRYEHETIFFIGTDAEREERQKRIEKNYPYYNPVSFCYVADRTVIEIQKKYLEILQNAYKRLQDDLGVFREMVRKELANHEACITCDYKDALDALGLEFEELTEGKQQIVKQELKKQIQSYY